jgi:hypothetical protein
VGVLGWLLRRGGGIEGKRNGMVSTRMEGVEQTI